ncbi:MAG: extensin family protein [Deltaproteobacteria bacterium]|nr:extensin family protein [Deltaproteobacteria bacterium]
MSLRSLLALMIAAGVAYTPSPSSAETTTTRSKIEASTKKSKSKSKAKSKIKKKKKKSKKKKKKSRKKLISRTPSKSSLRRTDNMPLGYEWPPNKKMLAAEKACQTELDVAGVDWKPAKPEGRIVAALTVTDADGTMTLGGIKYTSHYRRGPHKLDCQLALALHHFGPDLHAAGVRSVKFGSIFRWTNVRVNGETKNILSRHALGIAMDIVSFTDETGREANVETDYPTGDPLLLAVEAAAEASGKFRVLLTPKNDPVSHRDHFHIEVAVDYTRSHHTAALP